MKKILLSALMLTTFVFISCNSSDDNNDTSGIYLPSKIQSDENLTTFVYDSENRLIESKDFNTDGSYTSVVSFVYTNGRLVSGKEVTTEVETNSEGVKKTYNSTNDYVFVYQNNEVTITRKTISSSGTDFTSTFILTIDSEGKLQSGNGKIVTYNSDGNLVKLVENYSNEVYSYDNKNGLFKNVKTPQWAIYLLKEGLHTYYINNMIESSYENTQYNDSDISKMTYKYNSSNYPVKMDIVGSDGFLNSVSIEYIIK